MLYQTDLNERCIDKFLHVKQQSGYSELVNTTQNWPHYLLQTSINNQPE